MRMRIEWDERKDQRNRAKHGVGFETAALVFEDPNHLSVQDRHERHEERWQTLGLAGGIVVLLVAHTWREDDGEEVVRIISARKATTRERRRYEQGDPTAG
ncbi:MAG: BrnT family toxin [Halofilum sp. (in: g-proteobacteria)]|nr:BrnT family toxin [Halofilum sp. (in: g-proteobacteria)]